MRCGTFEIRDVSNAGCLGCGMFTMGDVGQNVENVGYLRYGVFKVWDIRHLGCLEMGC